DDCTRSSALPSACPASEPMSTTSRTRPAAASFAAAVAPSSPAPTIETFRMAWDILKAEPASRNGIEVPGPSVMLDPNYGGKYHPTKSPARGRVRHPDDPGVPRGPRSQHDHDLHARPEPGRLRRSEPARL